MCSSVCLCARLFLDYVGMAHVLKMKVRVELMVVKGPSVYLVLFNMKYKALSVPHSPLPPVLLLKGLGRPLTSESQILV